MRRPKCVYALLTGDNETDAVMPLGVAVSSREEAERFEDCGFGSNDKTQPLVIFGDMEDALDFSTVLHAKYNKWSEEAVKKVFASINIAHIEKRIDIARKLLEKLVG